MKKQEINSIRIFLVIGILISVISFASCANIGISPANIYYKNVLRGGYAERTVIISIDSEEPTKVSLATRGDIADWIKFDKKEFEVSRGKPYYLKLAIQPPIDIPNGNYSGFLRVTTNGKAGNFEGQATGVINAALDLYVQVDVTDVQYSSCQAFSYNVQSAEKGDPVIFNVNVLNEGNVRLSPVIKVNIWDQDRINLIKEIEYADDTLIPTTEKTLSIKVNSNDLEIGQYWAEVTAVDCYSSETLTFDILEEGALKAMGNLMKIITLPWINVGDTTSIEALFENTGEKAVNARFNGQITLGNKIVQILESESSLVEIGKTQSFNFYFTPKKEGKYIVTGIVQYDGKKTFEKSSVINVEKKGIDLNKILILLVYAILITGIAYLMYKIKKQKEKNKKFGGFKI